MARLSTPRISLASVDREALPAKPSLRRFNAPWIDWRNGTHSWHRHLGRGHDLRDHGLASHARRSSAGEVAKEHLATADNLDDPVVLSLIHI